MPKTYEIVPCNPFYNSAFEQVAGYCAAAPNCRLEDKDEAIRRCNALQAEFPAWQWEVNEHEGRFYNRIHSAQKKAAQ